MAAVDRRGRGDDNDPNKRFKSMGGPPDATDLDMLHTQSKLARKKMSVLHQLREREMGRVSRSEVKDNPVVVDRFYDDKLHPREEIRPPPIYDRKPPVHLMPTHTYWDAPHYSDAAASNSYWMDYNPSITNFFPEHYDTATEQGAKYVEESEVVEWEHEYRGIIRTYPFGSKQYRQTD